MAEHSLLDRGLIMALNLRDIFKSAANCLSARTRISIGLVLLLVGVLCMAMTLGLIPSERQAVMAGRGKICEEIAVFGSEFVQRSDLPGLDEALHAVAARNPDILSAALRQEDGKILIQIGDHTNWNSSERSVDAKFGVPILVDGKRWGELEVRFKSAESGIAGSLFSQQIKLIVFIASASMVVFLIYLRKMLQHLDPSKVVPPRVRSAMDTIGEGLLVLDNRERIVLANQAFATLVGRTSDEMLGSRASQFNWILDGGESTEFPWTRALREGKALTDVQMRLVDSSFNRRTFKVNCSPVLGQDGKYRGVLNSFDDITLLEEKEVELRKSRDAADAANQAKSEFLARMSHEIRTPMNAILGFAEVLRRGYEDGEAERQEYLDTIHSSGQHLLELINDILDLSKIESGKLEIEQTRCSPHQLLSETISILSVKAEQKGLSLDLRWDSPVPETILTDPTRFRQMVTNLVGNSIKFTEKGSVQLAARTVTIGGESKLIVDVIDTGIGMKPEVLDRIFTPFAQADTSITRRFGGTGLGLSISRQIADALGGSLTVASEYGKGSTFTITINTGSLEGVPMIDPSRIEESRNAEKKQEAAIRLTGSRVLLVEDGASNRKLIMLVLTRLGATVEWAEDGKSGADKALAGNYDVVLMDMQMPVMDGYTAARLCRSKGLSTPIIALTAHAMRGDEEKCLQAGCSGFLTKPIDMDLLVRTVAEASGKRVIAAAPAITAPRNSAAFTSPTARLRSSLPQDDPEFCEIIVEFVDRLNQQLGAMQQAWEKQDLAELASLAHWLKGSGGTAGFAALTDPARKLESLAKEKKVEEIAGAIQRLQALADSIDVPAVIRVEAEGVAKV